MVVDGVVVQEFRGKQREEFCQFDSQGNWVCCVFLVEPKVKVRAKGPQDPFVLHGVGTNYEKVERSQHD